VTLDRSLGRLRASPLPRVLLVSHAAGGGVARHIAELARVLEGRAEALLLQPHGSDAIVLRSLAPGDAFAVWMHAETEWERAVAFAAAIGIDRVHFHHVHGLPVRVLDLPARLGCAHDVTLHDYYPACPGYHLTDGRGRFCGGKPDCRRCLEARPAQWPMTIDAWRGAFGKLLGAAGRVIAPSEDAATRIRSFFPDANVVVWPHPEGEPTAAPTPLRVLVPGAISPAKGLEVLEACVEDAAARGLPLHFRVLGFTARPIAAWPDRPYSFTGEYRESDLARLIALERGDAFFFPAQVPETYSYTLSAALATGLPIVATDLGAFRGRLADRANARLVPWDAPAAEMNDTILAAVAPPSPAHSPLPEGMTPAAYRERYLSGLARGGPPGPLPAIHASWLAAPAPSPHLSTLAWLYDDGVRAGRGSSLVELRRRAAEADDEMRRDAAEIARQRNLIHQEHVRAQWARAEVTLLRDERDQLTGERATALEEAGQLRDEARDLRGRLEMVLKSRSWRLTAPLRLIKRLFRRG
jgi:glycosyltransferase involved in cell wall biosynthesis